ncbi:hypothetical protein BS17DRAFT_770611 [Gyrodon lividus]|nr:hypothetical protein BS17DRAFT_770611 [Gyrodon lividus]
MLESSSILKQIIAQSERYLTNTLAIDLHAKQPLSASASPEIILPDAPPLLSALLAAGTSTDLATRINHHYQLRAQELKKRSEGILKLACSNLRQHTSMHYTPSHAEKELISVFSSLHLKKLRAWGEEIIDALRRHAVIASTIPTTSQTKGRHRNVSQPFNHEYVPLLEHFFDENAFPTHADKCFLAKKTNMTYRQIHVWFQNRRNRTKKEKFVLRRKPMTEGAMLPMDNLFLRMNKYIIRENKCAEHTRDDALPSPMIQPNSGDIFIFSTRAPRHAFPSVYPPSCSYNPFPVENGHLRLDAAVWHRTPCSQLRSGSVIDMVDITEKFSQLTVRDGSSSRSRAFVPSTDSCAATIAITTTPPPAPLPALIFGPMPPVSRLMTTFPTVPAPAGRLRAFETPSPNHRTLTLIPDEALASQKSKRGVRKLAPLPKRLPLGDNVSYHAAPPAVSATASPSPSPFCSSGSSVTQSYPRSRVLSDSSSSNSSYVATPDSSPFVLPTEVTCVTPFIDLMEDRYHPTFSDPLSLVHGIQLGFSCGT